MIEKGKYKECIRMLTELSTQIKDITLLCEIRLTMADANQRLQLLNQSKLHYDYVLKNATDVVQRARANNGLGSYYCILSDFDSAVLYYNNAFKLIYMKRNCISPKPYSYIKSGSATCIQGRQKLMAH